MAFPKIFKRKGSASTQLDRKMKYKAGTSKAIRNSILRGSKLNKAAANEVIKAMRDDQTLESQGVINRLKERADKNENIEVNLLATEYSKFNDDAVKSYTCNLKANIHKRVSGASALGAAVSAAVGALPITASFATASAMFLTFALAQKEEQKKYKEPAQEKAAAIWQTLQGKNSQS